jgi:ABC-type nitrate/sulfonate/bicarbonate transport system ATPase subunit
VLADRVLVLADGRITFSAPVDVPRDQDRDQNRDRDHPALIELRHELLHQLGVSQEG